MMILAQYHRMLETLFGCSVYSVRFMTDSKMRLGSGRAPCRTTLAATDLEYEVPAAPSWGNITFWKGVSMRMSHRVI